MADITVNTEGQNWVITAGGSTPLPYVLWPASTDLNPKKPFLPRRMVATMQGGAAGNEIIIMDGQGSGTGVLNWYKAVASNDGFMAPIEFKRATYEQGPLEAIITRFDTGWELEIYF